MIGQVIRDVCAIKHIGVRELARESGVSTSILWRVFNGQAPNLSTLEAIARAIGKPRWEIIKEADERAQRPVDTH